MTGNEYFINHQRRPQGMEALIDNAVSGQEFCHNFYMSLQGNMCVNRNLGADFGQWCYVSSQCTALNNGEPGHPLNMKLCTAEDNNLRSNSPRQLASIAHSQNLDLGLLHKMSYPVSSHFWPEVSAFWGINGTASDLAPSLRKEMEDIAATGRPHSFDVATDHHPPHRIVVGQTVFAVHFSGPMDQLDGKQPGTWTALECLRGCDLATAQ